MPSIQLKLILALCSLSQLGCDSLSSQPEEMHIQYEFVDSSAGMVEACGNEAGACAHLVDNVCVVVLPLDVADKTLSSEMNPCGGYADPTVTVYGSL